MQDYNNHTTKVIHELYNDIRDGRLILQPDFQRRLVWSNKHKLELIDTVLKGFPFPEVYIADRGIDIENITSERVVVDGQQRMDTIRAYIEGELDITTPGGILPYAELSDEVKQRFLNYRVVVCQIYGAEQDTIKEIFRRINLTRYPLNPYEINNAVYDGAFMTSAKEISGSIDWDSIPAFKPSDIARMREVGFILNVMATIEEGGYSNGDDIMSTYVEKYNDSYERSELISKEIIDTVTQIIDLKLPKKSIWNRKSNYFTLVVELLKHRLNGNEVKAATLRARLDTLEIDITKNKKSGSGNEYSDYYNAMITGTNQRGARILRGRVFHKDILSQ
jgi:hypothetical protein